MPIDPRGTFKHMYACELAEALWDRATYHDDPEMLYVDLQEAGYEWTGDSWLTLEYIDEQRTAGRRKRAALASATDLEKLRDWQEGKPIKG